MDGIVAVFLAAVAALGLFASGPKLDGAATQVKAADRQHELACGNQPGLRNRTEPVFDYETASRREGGIVIHKC